MGKTLFLGNENTKKWADTISNSQFLQMPIFSLGEDGERKLCEYVVSNIDCDSEVIVIDVDEISNPELCLALAMTVRLSIMDIKSAALAAILFASRATQDILTGYKYSSVILTDCVIIDSHENLIDALDVIKPLSPNDYKERFLNFVKIIPNATEGRHSLANQWGASIIDKILNKGVPSDNPIFMAASKLLYFKYVQVQTIDVSAFLSGKQQTQYYIPAQVSINAKGKRILLIDDEAEKGWEYVLKRLVVTNDGDFDVIAHKARSYNDFTIDERKQIEGGKYDLIFLDLRMNGAEEENVYKPEEFSGMKILKYIKGKQPGLQVIMFTASNKAWNLKALLDAGADGYYIKESPEYKFTMGFSIANFDALRENIKDCLKRSYLREVNNRLKAIKKELLRTHGETEDLKNGIIHQMELSYDLLYMRLFEHAFVSLYQVIELVNQQFLDRDGDNIWYIIDTEEDCKNWSTGNSKHECKSINFTQEDRQSKFPEWKKMASLYYQLWKQGDKEFGYKVQTLINERNKYLHNSTDRTSMIHNESGYLSLLDVIETICNLI